MKKMTPALVAALAAGAGAVAFMGTAVAAPTLMTDQQMGNVVAAGWGQNRQTSGSLTYTPGGGEGTYEDEVPYKYTGRPTSGNRSQGPYQNAYFA